MNQFRLLCLVPVAWLLTACTGFPAPNGAAPPSESQAASADRWTVDAVRDAAISNALVTQHALFPYHFQTGCATLNELGARDLATLAEYYRVQPGHLSVRRGAVSEKLYQARVETVSKALAAAGVDVARLKIKDEPAGGPGMASEQVVRILQAEAKQGSQLNSMPPLSSEGGSYTGIQTGMQEGSK